MTDDLTVPVEVLPGDLDRLHNMVLDTMEADAAAWTEFMHGTRCPQCKAMASEAHTLQTMRDRRLAKAIVAAKDSIR